MRVKLVVRDVASVRAEVENCKHTRRKSFSFRGAHTIFSNTRKRKVQPLLDDREVKVLLSNAFREMESLCTRHQWRNVPHSSTGRLSSGEMSLPSGGMSLSSGGMELYVYHYLCFGLQFIYFSNSFLQILF